MLPYFEQPTLAVGPFTIHAYGALVVAAILVGWRLTVWRAGKVGLDRAVASRMCRLMVLAGFAGAWVARTQIYEPGTWGGISSFGGLVGGLAAGLLLLRRSGQTLRYLDAVAFVFPVAWMIGRAGCFVAHDHPGIEATSFLAVRFPEGPRYDLGLIEMLFMIPIALLFLLLDRRPRPAGLVLGLFLAVYGPFRIALDQLHVTPNPDRWFGALALVTGLTAMFFVRPRHR
ncbi:MAG: prolipoprotein diacylglyceryl transferase [bacterium]|nr:prolipoprotein diacylglyceryl transferase [bacterium]